MSNINQVGFPNVSCFHWRVGVAIKQWVYQYSFSCQLNLECGMTKPDKTAQKSAFKTPLIDYFSSDLINCNPFKLPKVTDKQKTVTPLGFV